MGQNPELRELIRGRYDRIRLRIGEAARRSGREPGDVTVVAVSKTVGAEAVSAALEVGIEHIGENRVQEAALKVPRIQGRPVVHMIGHLQSNKTRHVPGLFHWVESVDTVRLLARIDRAAAAGGSMMRLLIQVDMGGEPTKYGAEEAEIPSILEAAAAYPMVSVDGLMCIPPFFDDPEKARPYFARLREIRDGLRREGLASERFLELSMGMSHDFEIAVEEGATLVRIGTALFGERGP